MGNFHSLEVVSRGSGTQHKVGKNINYLIRRFKVGTDTENITDK